MAFTFTIGLKLTATDLEPITAIRDSSLSENPPQFNISVIRDGTLRWDFHTSATPPAAGSGNIATGTMAVVGGPNELQLNLSSYAGQTGYLHYRVINSDGESNVVTSQQITVGSSWTPAELFAGGENGAFWDFTTATCYTDEGRTSAASVGASVAGVKDVSGNANHVAQRTSAYQPVLGETAGKQYLTFDGSDDVLSLTGLDLSQTNELTIFSLYDLLTVQDTYVTLLDFDGASLQLKTGGGGEGEKQALATASGAQRSVVATVSPVTAPICQIAEAKISTNHLKVFANGQTATQSSTFGSDSNWGTGQTFYLGYDAHMRLYACMIINRLLTAGEITSLQNWAKDRGGITW